MEWDGWFSHQLVSVYPITLELRNVPCGLAALPFERLRSGVENAVVTALLGQTKVDLLRFGLRLGGVDKNEGRGGCDWLRKASEKGSQPSSRHLEQLELTCSVVDECHFLQRLTDSQIN